MVSAVDSLPQSALANASQFPIGNEWRERLDLTLLKQVWSLSYRQTQALIQQCMASKGFSYEPVEFVYNTDLLYRVEPPERRHCSQIWLSSTSNSGSYGCE